MRLTHSEKEEMAKFNTATYDNFLTECYNKLSQLEDIEETIEIDLLTVLEAVKNGFYDAEGNFYEPYDFSIDLESKCLRETFEDYMKSKSFGLWEFGKTWFLTNTSNIKEKKDD